MTVRWIDEPLRADSVRWLGQLGALGTTDTAQAKALLASWNTTDGNNCINNYGLEPADVDPTSWGNRDGWVLSCFTNWWNANHRLPPLLPPGTQNGVGWVDLDQVHLTALQQWGLSKGVLNAGQVPCATNCTAKYASDPVNLAKCLAICGTGQQPPLPPVPTTNCPGGMYWDTAGQTCKCPAGQAWNDATKKCEQVGGPLPPPPNPITPSTTAGTSSGAGLLIAGAVVLAAVGIFAAVVGGGGAAVPRRNPRRRRSNPRKRKHTPSPTLVDIQCETPSGWRDFRRIAAGGVAPYEMYGRDDPANKAWQLPDTIDRMHPRFHQLLQATGCVAVPVEPLANPRKPVPEAGYSYFYDGSNWKISDDEMWETEVMSFDEVEDAKHVGTRTIDGTRVNVWQLAHGKPIESHTQGKYSHHYIAQTARG